MGSYIEKTGSSHSNKLPTASFPRLGELQFSVWRSVFLGWVYVGWPISLYGEAADFLEKLQSGGSFVTILSKTRWEFLFQLCAHSHLNEHPFPHRQFPPRNGGTWKAIWRPCQEIRPTLELSRWVSGVLSESFSGWCYKVYTDRSGTYMGDRWCRKRLSGKLHYPIGSCKSFW